MGEHGGKPGFRPAVPTFQPAAHAPSVAVVPFALRRRRMSYVAIVYIQGYFDNYTTE